MSDHSTEIEVVLCAAYAEEADCYAKALRLAEELPTAFHRGECPGVQLQRVLAALDEVAAIEVRIADSKRRWLASRVSGWRMPGLMLQRRLAQVKDLIQHLASLIRCAEQDASAQRERMVPEVDAVIRGQQMLRAYKCTRKAAQP